MPQNPYYLIPPGDVADSLQPRAGDNTASFTLHTNNQMQPPYEVEVGYVTLDHPVPSTEKIATLVVPATFADWVMRLEGEVRSRVLSDKALYFPHDTTDADVGIGFKSLLSPDGVSLCVSLPMDWQLIGGDGLGVEADIYRPTGELGVATLALHRVMFGSGGSWGFVFELTSLRLVGNAGSVLIKKRLAMDIFG